MTIYSPTDVVVVAEWFQSPTHPPLIYYSSNRRHSHHSDEQTVACVVARVYTASFEEAEGRGRIGGTGLNFFTAKGEVVYRTSKGEERSAYAGSACVHASDRV